MDNTEIGLPPTPPKKIGKFSSIALILFSLALAFITINLVSYDLRFEPGEEIIFGYIIAPLLLIVISCFYYWLLKKIYNPKLATPILIVAVVVSFSVYYFRLRSPEPYASQIVTERQIYYPGDQVELTIIPENPNEIFYNSNSINIPISLRLPDGSAMEGTATIMHTTSNCESHIWFNKCQVREERFGFGASSGVFSIFTRDIYKLSQVGSYVLTSSSPLVKGTAFEVKAGINQEFEQQVAVNPEQVFPKTIGLYSATTVPHKIHTTDNSILFYSAYISPEHLNKRVEVEISSFNSEELADESRWVDVQTGDRVDKSGQQVVQTFRDSTAKITWPSNNKIISIWASAQSNSPIDEFLKVFLDKYPSTLKKNTSGTTPLPGQISTYIKDGSRYDTNVDGYNGTKFTYISPIVTGGGNIIYVDVNKSNTPGSLTEADLDRYIKELSWAYDRKDIVINNKKLAYVWVNSYGQKSPYFPTEVGLPVISWVSGKVIISIIFQKDKNNMSFNVNDQENSDFIRGILDVHPNTTN